MCVCVCVEACCFQTNCFSSLSLFDCVLLFTTFLTLVFYCLSFHVDFLEMQILHISQTFVLSNKYNLSSSHLQCGDRSTVLQRIKKKQHIRGVCWTGATDVCWSLVSFPTFEIPLLLKTKKQKAKLNCSLNFTQLLRRFTPLWEMSDVIYQEPALASVLRLLSHWQFVALLPQPPLWLWPLTLTPTSLWFFFFSLSFPQSNVTPSPLFMSLTAVSAPFSLSFVIVLIPTNKQWR